MASTKLIPIPNWQVQDIYDLQLLLEQAVAWVIRTEELETKPANNFKRRMVSFIQRQCREREFTFITTNYDIWLEKRLFGQESHSPRRIAKSFDFGFAWRKATTGKLEAFGRPDDAHRRLGWYKLHGSFNWLRCELCGQIYVNTYGSIVDICLLFGRLPETECHCGHFPLRPVLVSPSFVRDIRDSNLLEIWRHSLEALRRADEWIFVGYSFPEEDFAIRSMLMRAYNGWERVGKKRRPLVRVITRPRPDGTATNDQIARSDSDFEQMRTRALAVLPTARFERVGAESLFDNAQTPRRSAKRRASRQPAMK